MKRTAALLASALLTVLLTASSCPDKSCPDGLVSKRSPSTGEYGCYRPDQDPK